VLHYNEAYVIICGSQYKFCGAYPKSRATFQHLSPDAVKVSQHLTNTTGQSVPLSLMLQSTLHHHSVIEGSNVTLQQSPLRSGSAYVKKAVHKLTMSILQTINYVAQDLLMGKAVLLPWVCKVFLALYSPNCSENNKRRK